MKSVKCPGCGLVNFATTAECKRCRHQFRAPEQPAVPAAASVPTAASVPAVAEEISPAPTPNQPKPQPRPDPLPEYEPVATPIGGWLIVFGIGLGISLGLAVLQIIAFTQMVSTRAFQDLTTEGSAIYVPNFKAGVTLEVVWLSLLGIGCVILLIRFFRKSSSFPRLAVAVLAANIAFAFLDYLMGLNVERQLMEKLTTLYGRGNVRNVVPSYISLVILYSIISSGAWISYFLTSRRVESTFIY